MAHRYPKQLVDLVKALLNFENSKVYIHIDLRAQGLMEGVGELKKYPNVEIITERYKVYWGSYNQIRATLALMKAGRKELSQSYYLLLSGQDFPIKRPIQLVEFLKKNKDKQFLINFKLPDAQWQDGGLTRLGNYYFNEPNWPWLLNKINALLAIFQNKLNVRRKPYFQQYGGANWFNLSQAALAYAVDFVKENPGYLNAFKYSRCADEMFVQSILLNSPFKDKVVSEDLRFTDWSTGPEFPRILRENDFDRLINSNNKFFARKFDYNIDSGIIEKLKQYSASN